MHPDAFFRATELGPTTYAEWRDGILEAEASGAALSQPVRSYPGYPRWPLGRVRPRLWPPLDRTLARRRCVNRLARALPARQVLSRLLSAAHGVTGADQRGPVPSAGGLQALELYLAVLEAGWLPHGLYHFDRAGHHLSQLAAGTTRADLLPHVPSLELVEGGALLWLLVGDGARVRAKYSARGLRFLLLEAGHLMQNLCLVSGSLGLVTVPLGGFFEAPLARLLALPETDEVLYAGVVGAPG
jgi:SagB-type dehydrogenase family enzyme